MTPRTYFGPCRAGLYKEFGWGEPCLNDASEMVSIDSPVAGLVTEAGFSPGETLMKLCGEHALFAAGMDGFNYARPLTVPYEPPVVTL